VVGLFKLQKYRKYFLALLVVLVLIACMKFTGFERPALGQAEVLLRGIVAPLQSGVMTLTYKIDNFFEAFLSFRKIQAQNKELQKIVEELREENNLLREYRQENARLRKLLDFQEAVEGHYTLTPARVIARNPENWFRTLTINKGFRDGIQKNMPVINDKGVVGRVINVTAHTSEVLLILDREGAVGALIQQTRAPGIVEGLGPNTDELQMVHLAHDAPVSKNQVVITSGFGGIFPKGLRIGYVKKIIPEANGLMKRAIVQPFVDFNRLEEVMVVTGVGGQ